MSKKIQSLFLLFITVSFSNSSFANLYSDSELYSISRNAEKIGRLQIADGGSGEFNQFFGNPLVSWLVVVSPYFVRPSGRYGCSIARVSAESDGKTIAPKYVGSLPASGGVQAYYRLGFGDGRSLESVRVAISGNTFIQNVCPVTVYGVEGAFQPYPFDDN
jgi:hypothetical protein